MYIRFRFHSSLSLASEIIHLGKSLDYFQRLPYSANYPHRDRAARPGRCAIRLTGNQTIKTEPTKAEAAKTEGAKANAAKAEPAKAEAAKAEAAKTPKGLLLTSAECRDDQGTKEQCQLGAQLFIRFNNLPA
jgi:hypothetical protein